MYIWARSDGSDGTCGGGEGRDHDDEQEDESVLDRFDRLDEVREVEACMKSRDETGNVVSKPAQIESVKHDREVRCGKGLKIAVGYSGE